MPIWLLSALRLLAQGAGLSLGFEAAKGGFGALLGDEEDFPEQGDFRRLTGGRVIEGQLVGGARRHRRRHRRRRALTAGDKVDIAFIAGTISKEAAKAFAVTLAARSR